MMSKRVQERKYGAGNEHYNSTGDRALALALEKDLLSKSPSSCFASLVCAYPPN